LGRLKKLSDIRYEPEQYRLTRAKLFSRFGKSEPPQGAELSEVTSLVRMKGSKYFLTIKFRSNISLFQML
jgi:hypothetical protein